MKDDTTNAPDDHHEGPSVTRSEAGDLPAAGTMADTSGPSEGERPHVKAHVHAIVCQNPTCSAEFFRYVPPSRVIARMPRFCSKPCAERGKARRPFTDEARANVSNGRRRLGLAVEALRAQVRALGGDPVA